MAKTRAKQGRRMKRGRQELAELNWGDTYPKEYDEPADWADPEDDYASEDGDWDHSELDDWDDEWEPPPGSWEEDELD